MYKFNTRSLTTIERKNVENARDMLNGNINRMCVTDDLVDLYDNARYAFLEISRIMDIAKALCHSSDSKEKIIVCRRNGQDYTAGEQVMVYGSMAMGRNAVILAFVVPLVVIVVWLFCAVGIFHINELLAIGIMVILLAVYYLPVTRLYEPKKMCLCWFESSCSELGERV